MSKDIGASMHETRLLYESFQKAHPEWGFKSVEQTNHLERVLCLAIKEATTAGLWNELISTLIIEQKYLEKA